MTDRTWTGLVDLQVNGFDGIDVNADETTAQTLIDLTRRLWVEGVTRYLPTIIAAPEVKIRHLLAEIAEARRQDPLIAHSIAGVHIEGPSLSQEAGPRGAHERRHLRDASLAELDRWQQVSGGLVRIVTLAPERRGTLEYIRGAVAQGVRVSIGHCAADPEQIRDAVAAGASLSTHLGNGIHAQLPRHPNPIWAQLAADDLTAMFIADGHHLPADALTAMIRAKGVERSILTSDSAALAGAAPGVHHTAVGGRVDVAADGRLTLPGSDLLAGSGASLRSCLAWSARALPFTEDELLTMASRNPARVLGSNPSRDRVHVELDDDVRVRRVVIAGTVVHETN